MNTKMLPTSFSPLHKTLHWTMAVLIIGMLCLGLYMADFAVPPFKFQLYFWHKSFGVLILALLVVRSLSRFLTPQPAELDGPKWQRMVAKAVHLALYLLMLAMPVTGYLMSTAGGHEVSFFGLFNLPALVPQNEALGKLANQLHGLLGWAFWGVIAMHAGGALYHHFVQKDSTLKRMLP